MSEPAAGGHGGEPSLNFELDEASQAVVEAAASILDGATDDAEATWKALHASGLLTLCVPTRLGGEGLDARPGLTLLTEVGRRGLSLPALSTVALGVLPLVRWGTVEQQDSLLSDHPVLTAALREPGDPAPARPATTATPDLAVTGTKIGVAYADRARALLVPVSTADGPAVAIVDPTAPGVTLTRTPSASDTPEWTVRFDGAVANGLLGGAAAVASAATVDDLYCLALAGACALGDGLVAGALALTSAHIGTRVQFGRTLAQFQAVTAQIADVYITARTLHLAALSAGWRLSQGLPEADADLAVAAFWLAREAPGALRTCHHLHGGLGVDVTYPLHRYSALVKDLVRFVGGPEARLDAVADHEASIHLGQS